MKKHRLPGFSVPARQRLFRTALRQQPDGRLLEADCDRDLPFRETPNKTLLTRLAHATQRFDFPEHLPRADRNPA
jgi:hypothetical protein